MSMHKPTPQKGGPCHPTASRAVRPALVNACELLLLCEAERLKRAKQVRHAGDPEVCIEPRMDMYLFAVRRAKKAVKRWQLREIDDD